MTKGLEDTGKLLLDQHEARKEDVCHGNHKLGLLAMQDTMAILGGKWKLRLIGTLTLKGKFRFKDLQREVAGIGAKMLSKELQELESNQILTRTVLKTKPISVEYEITPYGRSLEPIILDIIQWGLDHRDKIMKAPAAE